MVRAKIEQRTTGGPFVLRQAFKLFDKDASGDIDPDEFYAAMEWMGLQFTGLQVALSTHSLHKLVCLSCNTRRCCSTKVCCALLPSSACVLVPDIPNELTPADVTTTHSHADWCPTYSVLKPNHFHISFCC